MATNTQASGIPPDVLADMHAVADSLVGGEPVDPEVARRIRERADKARLEVLAAHGVQDIGVGIIREIRGDLPES
jgi:hypothetical protein